MSFPGRQPYETMTLGDEEEYESVRRAAVNESETGSSKCVRQAAGNPGTDQLPYKTIKQTRAGDP